MAFRRKQRAGGISAILDGNRKGYTSLPVCMDIAGYKAKTIAHSKIIGGIQFFRRKKQKPSSRDIMQMLTENV